MHPPHVVYVKARELQFERGPASKASESPAPETPQPPTSAPETALERLQKLIAMCDKPSDLAFGFDAHHSRRCDERGLANEPLLGQAKALLARLLQEAHAEQQKLAKELEQAKEREDTETKTDTARETASGVDPSAVNCLRGVGARADSRAQAGAVGEVPHEVPAVESKFADASARGMSPETLAREIHADTHIGLADSGGAAGAGITRALLIGINYTGTPAQLGGCINDVRTVQATLATMGFAASEDVNTRVLTEEDARRPTRKNIIEGMQWLTRGARAGDVFWFHYSGHGSQVSDRNGEEEDGKDESICPLDYVSAGTILLSRHRPYQIK
jgi:hypothetical protein